MSPSKTSKRILVLMSGSIAAYKACQVLSRLAQAGHQVEVAASASALKFIGSATIEGLTGRAVHSDLWEQGRAMDHIHLARWADLIIALPASAHFINRLAHGLGDDLLTSLFLAHDFKKPFLIAPAMNTSMYQHPATQNSLKILRDWGLEILEAASGVLACGETGYGRLLEPDQILGEIQTRLDKESSNLLSLASRPTTGKAVKILLTAGGTRERIDDVRVLTNVSTGRSGARLADRLSDLGFDVFFLHGEGSALPSNPEVRRQVFTDTTRLEDSLKVLLGSEDFTHVIQMAAISDYRLSAVRGPDGDLIESHKISSGGPLTLELEPTPKLITFLKSWSRNPDLKVVGFKLTSQLSDTKRAAAALRVLEHADLVLGNDLAEINEAEGRHPYTLYTSQGSRRLEGFPEMAGALSEWILQSEVSP